MVNFFLMNNKDNYFWKDRIYYVKVKKNSSLKTIYLSYKHKTIIFFIEYQGQNVSEGLYCLFK